MGGEGAEGEDRAQRIASVGFDPRAQPRAPVAQCNLCAGNRFVVLSHQDRYGYRIETHGCLRCGLVFLNPMLTRAAYRDFYASVYRPLVSAYHGRRIDGVTVQGEQRVYAAERAEFLAPFLNDHIGRTMLDIGGSTGIVANHLAQRFHLRATVLDPSPAELASAAALGLETIAGLVEEFEPATRRFDLVVLCQTIDHLVDVAGTLRKVRTLLPVAGLFYVDIVDFRAGYLRNASVEAAVKVDHPYNLTEGTAEVYLARAGFEIMRKHYAADYLHVGYLCSAGTPVADALPDPDAVAAQWREVRQVQNQSRARGG